jgi:hypothetical protein
MSVLIFALGSFGLLASRTADMARSNEAIGEEGPTQ